MEHTCKPEPLSKDSKLQRECDIMNDLQGKLSGYDCDKCKNKGVIYVPCDNAVAYRQCECMPLRGSLKRLKSSGLEKQIKKCTFDGYIANDAFQKRIKAAAQEYAENYSGKWFFIGGQSGCGKTHICTAIAGKLLEQRVPVVYMV